ncbi:MAG: YceI family protein [Sphingobacteriales bacterium]|nr:MAG: YceI family protein [Sphingobacteriales bacterium]
MKKLLLSATLLLFTAAGIFAQDKFFTKSGKIFFKCTKSSIEKIEATNKSTTCVLDTKTGNMQFAVLMKGFEFERALMQEHFNENYVESEKFPRGEFKGQITNNKEVNYSKDGSYPLKVKGSLTMHGVTKDVETTGTLTVKQGKLSTNAVFNIQLSDYNISIPSVVSDKISNTVNISVDCLLEPLAK